MAARVVFVIPYAGEDKDVLKKTVESALATTARGVVVVGDGVPTPFVANDNRLTYATTHKRGCAGTVNYGARIAMEEGAELIAFLDTGDTVDNDRLSGVPQDKPSYCAAHVPGVGVVGDEDGDVYTDNRFCASSTVVPSCMWKAIGGRDETLTYCSDWDVAVRIHHFFGWVRQMGAWVTANLLDGGLTKGADPEARNKDRVRVAKMAAFLSSHGRKA